MDMPDVVHIPTQAIVLTDPLAIPRKSLRQLVIASLKQFHRVRISSPPGSGKSSLITLIANDLSSRGVRCKYVPCVGFKRSPLSAQQYVLTTLQERDASITDWEYVSTNVGCLFLDDAHTLYKDSSFLENLIKSDSKLMVAVFTSFYAELVDAESPSFDCKVRTDVHSLVDICLSPFVAVLVCVFRLALLSFDCRPRNKMS
jgi:hypothetical protein